MNTLHKILAIAYLTLSTSGLFADEQQAQLFNAEDGSTGKYWADSKKAVLLEDEYINVIAIKKSQLNKTSNKKLRKYKNYLGLFINEKSGQEYYLYGNLKNPAKVDDGPDADVITEIAIKEDYGPGE